MKKLITFSFMAVVLLMSFNANAQKMLKEGVVKFEVTEVSSTDPQANMMKGTTMDLYFTKNSQRVDINMMGGMVRINTISNKEKDEEVILTDMMGKKIQVKSTEEELAKIKKEKEDAKDLEITYDRKDTKKIAGFECYRADIKMASGDTLIAYVTQQIKPEGSYFDKAFKGIDGFPLEYTMGAQGIMMTYTALEVSDAIDQKAFEIPEGYEEMSLEEFQKSVGGMGF